MKAAFSNRAIEAGEAAKLRGDYLEARGAFETALEDPDPLVVGAAHHCLGKLSWHEGAFDAANPRKGGAFVEVSKEHNVEDEYAAYRLADEPWT